MQPTWRQALVLIAAWLQGWRAWGHFKPFIVYNHTVPSALQQSFQDFLDRCRRSVLRCVLKSPSPDNNCISAWKHDLHTAATVSRKRRLQAAEAAVQAAHKSTSTRPLTRTLTGDHCCAGSPTAF